MVRLAPYFRRRIVSRNQDPSPFWGDLSPLKEIREIMNFVERFFTAKARRRPTTHRTTVAIVELLEPRELLSGAPIPFAQPATPVHSFYVDPVNGSMSGDGSQ